MSDQALLFELGYDDPDSLIGSYIRHIANGGLTSYKSIFQTGGKAGEPVYVHFLNAVFAMERLRHLVGLRDDESRVLYSALSVHDINKLVEGQRKSFNRLAVNKVVQTELERIGVPDFFPSYLEYMEDITFLVRYHSAHYSTAGEMLIPAFNPYRLDRNRLHRVLGNLIRAADILELSTTLEERVHKASFLAHLNAASEAQYTFVTHRIAEQRGLLTNLIHNRVSDYLEQRHGLTPLLFYPEGVAYLAHQNHDVHLSEGDLEEMGLAVARAAANMSRGNFAKFIRSGNQGIKVNKQCLELGVSFADIFAIVFNLVAAKVVGNRFDIPTNEAKARGAWQAALRTATVADVAEHLQERLGEAQLYPPTQAGMGAGELLRTYYIFLADHFGKTIKDPWQYLYGWLGVTPEQVKLYNLLDPRYQRAYVVAHDLGLSLEPLYERILTDGARLLPAQDTGEESLGDYAALTTYVQRTVSFDFVPRPPVDFNAALIAYTQNNHRQCCYCGSEYPTDEWMSVQVPANVAVQSFSNRLPGGSRAEPKRYVCDICRVQFTLEKLAHQTLKGIKTVYIHLYPYTFYTDVFLRSLRDEVQGLLAEDTSVLFPRTDDAFRTLLAERRIELPVSGRNKQGKPYQNGIVLPQYAETLGNILIFPLNCPGDNDAERFLFALQSSLLLQRFFGGKAILTESPVPILDRSDFTDLYIDGQALGFQGLLPQADFDRARLENVWDDLLALHRMRQALYSAEREENPLLSLVRALGSESRLEVYYVADRLVEHKAVERKPDKNVRTWRGIAISQRILPDLRALRKGGVIVQPLRRLAEMAWEGHIIGRSLERNSLLKPFDMLLDGLDAKSEAFDLDTLRAQLVEDIFRHLEAIASEEYKPGRTKREKVKAYVDQFFNGVLADAYHGNATKLLADSKGLRSAYLFYVREQIPVKTP